MGDVAELIMEGALCETCGVLMDDHDAPGYPRQCEDCKRENDDD